MKPNKYQGTITIEDDSLPKKVVSGYKPFGGRKEGDMQYYEPEIPGNVIWHKSGDGGGWAKREDVEALQRQNKDLNIELDRSVDVMMEKDNKLAKVRAQLDRAMEALLYGLGNGYTCPHRLRRSTEECDGECEACIKKHIMENK